METKPEEKTFVDNLIDEITLPNDALPGETPTTYKQRKKGEEYQKMLNEKYNSKNQ